MSYHNFRFIVIKSEAREFFALSMILIKTFWNFSLKFFCGVSVYSLNCHCKKSDNKI